MQSRIYGSIVALMAIALASPALAQTRSQVWGGPLIQQAQTVSVEADLGMTTYESEAAGSKETKESSNITMAGWAGENRIIGASITSSEANVPFTLNDSKMKTSFRDVRLMARIFWLIPYVNVSLSEIDVTKADAAIVGLYGTGMGAGLALAIPLHDRLVLQAEGGQTQSSKVYDKLGADAKLGARNDADAHLSFDITDRIVDLVVGYRLRSYEIETADATYKEQSQGAYVGIRLGLYF